MSTITPQILLKAYAAGIFPMAESAEDNALYWVEPELRGLLPLESFHIPRSLRKTVRQAPFEIRVDSAFGAVIEGCSAPAPNRRSTWIIVRMIESGWRPPEGSTRWWTPGRKHRPSWPAI